MIRLALYKGAGDWMDSGIRIWTRSPYSHCEIVLPDGRWVTSSPREGGVVSRVIVCDPSEWDFIDLPWVTAAAVEALFEAERGARYDWIGLLGSQVLPVGIQSHTRWFCSEFCATVIGLELPQRYSPGSLAEVVRWAAQERCKASVSVTAA